MECAEALRCIAGFKLDTLLKLADVKGVDRKTSLLHFVLDQLLKDSDSLASLSSQLKSVRPAANLQVPSPSTQNFLLYIGKLFYCTGYRQ